ncbi:MAG TPA: BREX system ATP-binding domain-containing protein [Candidatus Dormibacteraeota bacterium]|nr:BREX system ATP-binding domain-containing protein [Candidatus Dormibacteraeota bacterium]
MLTVAAETRGIAERRSIEALRAGVPNGSAVRELGTDQKAIEARFLDSLSQVAAERSAGRQLPGSMVQGEFGTGKSHLLQWLQHVSLEAGFACSKIVIGKETPLGDPHKLYRAASEALVLPDRVGGLPEVVERLRLDSNAFADLYGLVRDPDSRFDPLFQTTLLLYEKLHHDTELLDRIIAFWSGDRPAVNELKRQLKLINHPRPDLRSRRIGELALPRFRFLAQLIAAAGYTGWVLLLDEVELIANLSLVSREKSYATLAALAGRLRGRAIPGLFMIGTVTAEFTGVIFEQRRDREKALQRWGERGPDFLAEVEAGLEFLAPGSRRWMRIRPPDADALRVTYDRVRELYARAYGWRPPAEAVGDTAGPARSMRQYVRDWITRWDLARLDPSYLPDIETREVSPDLTERPDLEASDEPEADLAGDREEDGGTGR